MESGTTMKAKDDDREEDGEDGDDDRSPAWRSSLFLAVPTINGISTRNKQVWRLIIP